VIGEGIVRQLTEKTTHRIALLNRRDEFNAKRGIDYYTADAMDWRRGTRPTTDISVAAFFVRGVCKAT